MGRCLNEIIHRSQMGYVPDRDINFNNRVMRTAMGYCNEKKLDYTITSLDAQKAYDSVSHEYISEVLKAYNFPQSFIDKVDLLHSNLKAFVQINGHISESFKIERGVKKGDALSCALFIIAIDPLIRNIENNPAIPPLEICSGCTVKTLAYANDIAVITESCDTAAGSVFYEYSRLTKCSALMLNADKTEILNLSELGKDITKVNYAESSLEIEHCTSTIICGNFMSLNDNLSYEKNILDKIKKLETHLNIWKCPNLTLNGKMIIIKTYAISQLILSSQFQSIQQKDLSRIEHLCYTFAWNGKDRVGRTFLKSERHNRGINGIDIESFFKSIALRQLCKLDSDPRISAINKSAIINKDIKLIEQDTIRAILLKQVQYSDDNLDWILEIPASLFVKTNSLSHKLFEQLNISTISSLDLIK